MNARLTSHILGPNQLPCFVELSKVVLQDFFYREFSCVCEDEKL